MCKALTAQLLRTSPGCRRRSYSLSFSERGKGIGLVKVSAGSQKSATIPKVSQSELGALSPGSRQDGGAYSGQPQCPHFDQAPQPHLERRERGPLLTTRPGEASWRKRERLTTRGLWARKAILLGQAPGQGRKETDSWLFLASVPPGKSLKVTLEPPAEGGPIQHNPAPPCAVGALQGQRETGRLWWLPQSHCLWVSSHLPLFRSDVSSEHTHTFQVAQKLPQCQRPHGPGAAAAGRTGPGGTGASLPSRGGNPGSAESRRPAEALLLVWAVSLLLSEGRDREGNVKLTASGPQGSGHASAAPVLPAGQGRRASRQRAVQRG